MTVIETDLESWPADSPIGDARDRLTRLQTQLAEVRQAQRERSERRQAAQQQISAVTSESSDAALLAAVVAHERLRLIQTEGPALEQRRRDLEAFEREARERLGHLLRPAQPGRR